MSNESQTESSSGNTAKGIENFIVKFLAADWLNKAYFILTVIFSVRMVLFLIPEIFLFPWSIKWMSIGGILAACLVYYGTAAAIVDTAICWFRSIRTMELAVSRKPRTDSVWLGVWMILIRLFFSKMHTMYNGKIMFGIYLAARRYLSVTIFILAAIIASLLLMCLKENKVKEYLLS